MGNQWVPLEKCKTGEVLLSAEFIPLAMVQQQKQVEVVDNVLKQDISSVEIPIQEIIRKDIEQEEDKKEEIKTQKSNKTGVMGLEDISKKDKKVSSDQNIKSDET